MSLVVFRKKGSQVEACADEGLYDDDGTHMLSDVKVWHADDDRRHLVGCVGDVTWLSVMRAVEWPSLDTRASEIDVLRTMTEAELRILAAVKRRDVPAGHSCAFAALWATAGRIFMVSGPACVLEVGEPYAAIGAGAGHAYGVLDAAEQSGGRVSLKAVVAACEKHCTYVRGVGKVRVTR